MSAEERGLGRSDLVGAALWFVVIVPPGFGFWLVAGELVGVPASDFRELVAASMLAVGVASLAQVVIGYRLPVFEGPAATYLAAVAFLAVSRPDPAEATGGLIVAGLFVFVLGLVGADRPLGWLFTPVVVQAFLLIIVVVAVPPTLEHAVEAGPGAPLGTVAGWTSAIAVVGAAAGLQRVPAARPFALLAALLLGALTFFVVDGFPDPELRSGGLRAPPLLPWGAPEVSASIAAPFLVAAVLSAFNTIASMRVMSETIDRPLDVGAGRRGLLAHGGSQAINACLGNLLGHVPRLDSASVVRLIDNPHRVALALGASAIIALAFIGPVIDVIAYLPVPVSAAMLAVVLGVLALQGLRGAVQLEPASRWLVLAPAVTPAVVWTPLADGMSETAQLVTNPLLLGVVLAVVLDRVVPKPAKSTVARQRGEEGLSARREETNWRRS